MDVSRRNFCGTLLAAAAPRLESRFAGVTIGVHSYSFRDRPLDQAIAAMVKLGIGECDLGCIHMELPRTRPPQPGYAEKLRQWRLTAPLDEFEKAGAKFRAAGIHIANYTYNFMQGPDAEIERGFEMAKALGAKTLAMSTRVSTAPQIYAAAKHNKMRVGLHNHSRIEPDQLATPGDFDTALRGRGDYLGITLDAGHFFSAGFDPVEFTRLRHEQILSLHLKDRKKNQGATVPFGEGDTPVTELLQLIRDNRYGIAGFIEHEYEAKDPVEEVRKGVEYCKRALLGATSVQG